MRVHTRVFALSTVVLLACARQQDVVRSGSSSRLQISEAELNKVGSVSTYDAIMRLRREFLTTRGETSLQRRRSMPLPAVYLDGYELGGVGELRNIPASQVASVRLYRSWEATTKFGVGYIGGVIEVLTKQ